MLTEMNRDTQVATANLTHFVAAPEFDIAATIEAVGRALEQPGYVKYVEVYRLYGQALRQIAAMPGNPRQFEAAELLKSLLLEQTLSFGELEANPDVDSYTGEPLDEIEEEDAIAAGLVVPEYGFTPFVHQNEWQDYITTRRPYADEAMNAAFVEANREYVGLEEEVRSPMDDREYVPDYFLPEVSVDDFYADLKDEFAPLASALRERISREVEAPSKGFFDTAKARRTIRHSEESKDALRFFQAKLRAGENIANVARLFVSFQHGLCWNWTDAKWLRLGREGYTSLYGWLEMFEDELLEAGDPAPIWDPVSDAEIVSSSNRLMDEYYRSLPEKDPNPRLTRAWIKGYIEGVSAGLPLWRYDSDTYTASDAAWDAWRVDVCPDAAHAYQLALADGAPLSEAKRTFYRVAREKGVTIPSRKEKVIGIRPQGLRLSSGRFVKWGLAGLKFREGELDLAAPDRERLKTILARKGWGGSFAAAL